LVFKNVLPNIDIIELKCFMNSFEEGTYVGTYMRMYVCMYIYMYVGLYLCLKMLVMRFADVQWPAPLSLLLHFAAQYKFLDIIPVLYLKLLYILSRKQNTTYVNKHSKTDSQKRKQLGIQASANMPMYLYYQHLKKITAKIFNIF